MANIVDESPSIIEDESSAPIEDEGGGGSLTVQSVFHKPVSTPIIGYNTSIAPNDSYHKSHATADIIRNTPALTVQKACHKGYATHPEMLFLSWLIPQDSFIAPVAKRPVLEILDGNLSVSDSYLAPLSEKITFTGSALTLEGLGSYHTFRTEYPNITFGGQHDNTEHISYSGQDYLKCRHLFGNLTGTYTSETFDIGSGEATNRHLVYIVGEDDAETDIVIVGEGTTWDDKFPLSTTWTQGNASTLSWSEIFGLPSAPSVRMRLYYGTTDPPTSYVDRMEILSAIIPATNRYFRVRITITDPNINVYAYVEAYTIKFATYS